MGSASSTYISRVDVSKSASGDEQSVVYSTPDDRTCILRVSAGKNSVTVSLRDYTFDREGTRVDIRVHRDPQTNNLTGGGCGDVGTIDLKYGGNALEVRKDAGQFSIGYGVPRVRCGFLVASKHHAGTARGDALFVTHVYSTTEHRLSVVVVQVWYDGDKGFMCALTGPTRHSSLLEAMLAVRKAYPPSSGSDNLAGAVAGGDPSGSAIQQQTTNTGHINNTGGPVYGDFNGSIVSVFYFFQNFQGGAM